MVDDKQQKYLPGICGFFLFLTFTGKELYDKSCAVSILCCMNIQYPALQEWGGWQSAASSLHCHLEWTLEVSLVSFWTRLSPGGVAGTAIGDTT